MTTPSIVQVLLPRPFDAPFDYTLQEGMHAQPGDVVCVPFGNSDLWGCVWSINPPEMDHKKIREVTKKADGIFLSETHRQFLQFTANYTLTKLGQVLALTLNMPDALTPPKPIMGYVLADEATWPANFRWTETRQNVREFLQHHSEPQTIQAIANAATVGDGVVRGMLLAGLLTEQPIVETALPTPPSRTPHFILSGEQQHAAAQLIQQVHQGEYHTTLIDGITGSGKTEVYFEAVREALEMGKQVLVLLPEIVLTRQLMERFSKRLGIAPTEWHSSLTPAQRRNHWRSIATGRAPLVVGARSALYLPYPKLGLIVVDEEHEPAYKQEDGVLYHGRDMAVARAHHENIPAILVSASPSIETLHNVSVGKFEALHLRERHGEATLPLLETVDMRREKLNAQQFLSVKLRDELAENLSYGEQSLLFLNRRGYAPLALCRKCGFRFESPETSAWMVMHKPRNRPPYLQCHHSGLRMPVPETCPSCHSENSIVACGPGVERLEEEVREILPQARITLMTSDTIHTPEEAEATVRTIEQGETDIVIGTQMVAKGHNFPLLTLVGIVDADVGLEGGDLRAAERTFQLLHQVAGRAGRRELKGRAIIQTYQPENPVLQALLHDDRDGFIHQEMTRRERAQMPPFSRLAALIISGRDEGKVKQYAATLARTAPRGEGVNLFGPAPAPMALLRGQFRYRLLLRTTRTIHIQKLLRHWLAQTHTPSALRLKVDIDPQSFM